jgi:hypothetical protein
MENPQRLHPFMTGAAELGDVVSFRPKNMTENSLVE